MIDAVNIPDGVAGVWRVERFEIPKTAMLFTFGHRAPSPGTYTRLMRGETLVMSDTPAERRDHYSPVWEAKGLCLVNGLGLGMVAKAILNKPQVERLTIVEISKEVIDLVAPHVADPRLEIVNSCAFAYQPPKGVRYGMVWHDIWDDICGDNLPQMHKLHRKYGRRCDWQGSWCRYECERGR